MSFGNGAMLPSETGVDVDGRTMIRRIKMHEFLMTGGIKVGEREGRATYSDPIKHTDSDWEAVCPWHGEQDGDCTAWLEIVAGRGYWTRLATELATLRADVADTGGNDAQAAEIDRLEVTLAMQPRDAKALRERTPEMLAEERAHVARAKAKRTAGLKSATAAAAKIAEGLTHAPNWKGVNTKGVVTLYCDAHRPRVPSETTTWTRIPSGRSQCIECAFEAAPAKAPVYAAAGPKRGGNPWDKMSADAYAPTDPSINYKTGEISDGYDDSGDWWNEGPKAPVFQEPDSRDEAIAAFADTSLPDTIEIDGDEGEEGDEGVN